MVDEIPDGAMVKVVKDLIKDMLDETSNVKAQVQVTPGSTSYADDFVGKVGILVRRVYPGPNYIVKFDDLDGEFCFSHKELELVSILLGGR